MSPQFDLVPDLRAHTEWAIADFRHSSHHDRKNSLAGEGGGYMPTLFQPIIIMYKVAVYTPAERADTFTYFLSPLPSSKFLLKEWEQGFLIKNIFFKNILTKYTNVMQLQKGNNTVK